MKITKGQIITFSSWVGNGTKKAKIIKIQSDDSGVVAITYKICGLFGYKNTVTTESFKRKLVGEVNEAEI